MCLLMTILLLKNKAARVKSKVLVATAELSVCLNLLKNSRNFTTTMAREFKLLIN